MKYLLVKMIVIMLLWFASSSAWAADCEPGGSDSKWTLYTENKIVHLTGKICGKNGWNRAVTKNEKSIYFGASFLFVEGHIIERQETKEIINSNKEQRINW